MSSDERMRRGLAVQRRLQENGMSFTKHRKVPDAMSVVREFRNGSDKDLGPPMVAIQIEGRRSPHLLVSEKLLKAMAPNGREADAALALASEMHAPQHLPPGGRPHGIHVSGKLHLSEDGRQKLAEMFAGAGLDGVDPDRLAEALDALYGGTDDDNAIIIGHRGMYHASEHEHGAGGRSVLSALDEAVKGGADGERVPRNVVRTITVRLSDDPSEDEQDDAGALDRLATRSKTRGSP